MSQWGIFQVRDATVGAWWFLTADDLYKLPSPLGDIWQCEKAMAPHSSTLAWRIPWMEEPGALPSMGSHRVGHD